VSNVEKPQFKKGLGRGLNSLLDTGAHVQQKSNAINSLAPTAPPVVLREANTLPSEARVWSIPIEKIRAHANQPRTSFEQPQLLELADSIKSKGIIQPLIVTKKGDMFELIAGERRWRAAQMAGLHEVPVIIRTANDQEVLELALIENIQRADLNPIEEAKAYNDLSERYHLSHSEIAEKVGKDRATITNALRLLGLEESAQKMLIAGEISTGHAKVLLGLDNRASQKKWAEAVADKKMSVRALEKVLQMEKGRNPLNGEAKASNTARATQAMVESVEKELRQLLATKVAIDYSEPGKGKISLYFYTSEQMNEMIDGLRDAWQR
jgi:ParB family chromosome partitioning protein